MDPIAGDRRPDQVRDPRRDFPDQAIVTVFSPATDQVVLSGQREQCQNIGRIELKVSVQRDDQLSVSLPEAGIERGGLAIVPIEVEDSNLTVLCCELVEQWTASIRAAVIDVHDLKGCGSGLVCGCQNFEKLFGEGRDVVPFILDGDDDRGPGTRSTCHSQEGHSFQAVGTC